ncbi:MAG: class I SAM-dependent methyltransferase [Hungatella sp.]|nr:class I SAM-dependent methyltransferase [Hungatella sp.]
MNVFQDYAYYYNLIYRDKDYKTEAEAVHGILKKFNPQLKTIINLGCGTGRHDIELEKLGYHCKGIDISPLMIKIARNNAVQNGSTIKFEEGDVRNYTTQEKYDAVISLFHVMSYQNTNRDILSAFKTARNLLGEKGSEYFLFDAWYGPGVLSEKPSVRVKEIEDEENRLIRIAQPTMYDKKNVVDVNYEILVIHKPTNIVETIKEVHSMRYFFKPELELLLTETGFELIDTIDSRTLGETDYNSWTSYFIARAV